MAQVVQVPPPIAPADLGFIWKTFIVGLVIVLILGIVGITALLVAKLDPAPLVTITTAALSGLIGVFSTQS